MLTKKRVSMKQNRHQHIEEDEIDLRELFATLGRYKWSIIFFTLLITFAVAVKVYFMPKYYQSTVTLEVKSENKAGGFSLGGAAAMLLGGGSGSASSLEKDITLLKTYRTNEKVLNIVDGYLVRYFITDKKHKEIEVEHNLSIELTDVKVNDFKSYGMRLLIKPLNKTEYKLLKIKRFFNEDLGVYHYSEMVKQKTFSLMVHKKKDFSSSYTVELAGTKRHIFQSIIRKNLSISADKESPFITLSFVDNLPHRGEAYLRNLINIYTKQSIEDIKEDASVAINSFDKQLQKVEGQVSSSSKNLEEYKRRNSIISPEVQATALVSELSKVGIQIAQNQYKQELLANLISFTKKNSNIDSIAPSLVELEDLPTIELIKIMQEQQLELEKLLLKYQYNHPVIVRANNTIYELKSKILSNLKNLQRTLKNKTKSLQKMEQSYNAKLQSSPKQAQELIGFSRDYQVNEKMYLYLMQERSAAQLKHDKALSRFKVIEEVYTADAAVKPKKALIVIVAFIASLIFLIFIAFFREFLKNSKSENE